MIALSQWWRILRRADRATRHALARGQVKAAWASFRSAPRAAAPSLSPRLEEIGWFLRIP